jgi:hypothetical protein
MIHRTSDLFEPQPHQGNSAIHCNSVCLMFLSRDVIANRRPRA